MNAPLKLLLVGDVMLGRRDWQFQNGFHGNIGKTPDRQWRVPRCLLCHYFHASPVIMKEPFCGSENLNFNIKCNSHFKSLSAT